jgi:hypothetical protein
VQLFYAAALGLSAALLFALEPMFAKMVLPKLGGSPSVWNICLVFYQAALLGGYLYAHLTVEWLGARRQAALHLAVLFLAWLSLPVAVAAGWNPAASGHPALVLLALLTVAVGLPFFCVSATAPLLQAWFAASGHRSAKDPYYLYAASNLGSMLGLAAYPLLVEPRLTLLQQARWWAVGYGVLIALMAGCAAWLWLGRGAGQTNEQSPGCNPGALPDVSAAAAPPILNPQSPILRPPTLLRRLRWLALAAVPSGLLLGVTAYMSTDIASMPFLWVIPLMLYLLTFVLVFSRWRWFRHRAWTWLQAAGLVLLAGVYYVGSPMETSAVLVLMGIHLAAFFLTAMVCHGALAADRPASEHLTEFYLWLSLGGVVGGLLCALVAPVVFSGVMEYPLMLVAACLLRPRPALKGRWWELADVLWGAMLLTIFVVAVWGVPARSVDEMGNTVWEPKRIASMDGKMWLICLAGATALLLARRPSRFAVALGVLLGVALACTEPKQPIYAARSFFGVLRVERVELGENSWEHRLLHGSTEHGSQVRAPELAREPCSYYDRDGPVGDLFDVLESRLQFRRHGRIGVVGLGTGTLAAYTQPGQHITFFEIDAAVEQIARNSEYFTYLTDCEQRGADLEVRLGDARLSLEQEPDRTFDVLLIDAFTSDAIPVHLLTREALKLYFDKLTERGLLAVHISNRHLNLEPVMGNLAEELHVAARLGSDLSSTWVVLAERARNLGDLRENSRWEDVPTDPSQGPWTDDFSNIVGVIRWQKLDWDWLPGWKWWHRKPKKQAEEQ